MFPTWISSIDVDVKVFQFEVNLSFFFPSQKTISLYIVNAEKFQ